VQVTGNRIYANKARISCSPTRKLTKAYPLHDNRRLESGHVASQSLTEASWLIDIAQGADLVWKILTDAEKTAVTQQILRPALDESFAARLGFITSSAATTAPSGWGFLLGDRELIKNPSTTREGIPRATRKRRARGRMWAEGSSAIISYYCGALALAEAARNCGVDLTPRSFNRCSTPPALAMPDLVLPDFNDSEPSL